MTGYDRDAMLSVEGLSCGYGSRVVLSDVSFTVGAAGVLTLLGPNGVGKSTLFKTILGFLPRLAGSVFLEGEEVSGWSRRRFARSVAYVPQTDEGTFGFTVRELVLMGRTPAAGGFAGPSRADERIACDVIDQLGLSSLADREVSSLSGGERQMVLIARALSQQPKLLMMDEPCANLDWGNQIVVLSRIRELARAGLAVVVTSHDPNHALLLESDVLCLGRDQVFSGEAADLLRPELLRALYGVDAACGTLRADDGREVLACAPLLPADEGCSKE